MPADLSDNARETSGVGLRGSVLAFWFPRLSPHWRGEIRGGVIGADYSGADFDDLNIVAELGIRRTFARDYAGVGLTYNQRWFANEIFHDAAGVGVSGQMNQGRWSEWVSLRATSYQYELDPRRNGPVVTAEGSISFAVNPTTILGAQAGATRETADVDFLRSTDFWVSASYSRELQNALTLSIEPFAGYRVFDGRDPLFTVQREDVRYGTAANALNRRWSWHGFTPALTYTFTRNESNTALFDYDRHQVEVRMTRIF